MKVLRGWLIERSEPSQERSKLRSCSPRQPANILDAVLTEALLAKGFNDAGVASISGRLFESSTDTVNGFPTTTMTAESNEAVIVSKQRMVVTSTMIYVLSVTGNAKAFEDDARLTQVLASLTALPFATPPPAFGGVGGQALATQPAPVFQQGPNGWNKISGELGVFGVVVLLLCYTVSRQSERKPRRKKSSVKKKTRE